LHCNERHPSRHLLLIAVLVRAAPEEIAMANGSGLLTQLASVSGMQVQSNTALAAADAGITEVAKLVPVVGTAVGIVQGILSIVDPSGSSGPTTQDLQNQIAAFEATVEQKLSQLQAIVAGGQVKANAQEIEKLFTGQMGALTIISELGKLRNSPGLPLSDGYEAAQYQQGAVFPLLTLVGGKPPLAQPPSIPPTPYWWLPAGDLPLFKPENPWTYGGTRTMFNQPQVVVAEGINLGDENPYTGNANPNVALVPQFDLSAFHFTNDFTPTKVAGIPDNNAFNPTWVLPQTMAAVYYYMIICGAVLQNFPNDGSTVPNFLSGNNFLGNLSWYHDQVRAGIVNIPPPYPTDLIPQTGEGLIAASADAGVSQWSVPSETGAVVGNPNYSAASAPPSEWSRPFGALCSYTGYVAGAGIAGSQPSVDRYPNYVYPTPGQSVFPEGPPPPGGIDIAPLPRAAGTQWYNGFYSKYLVACLWRAKLVYNGMGLADMWRTINNLYVMFGQPPRPGPCFGDWSLQEVFRMLGSANPNSFPLPAQHYASGPDAPTFRFTVRAFLEFMSSAPPTPPAPLRSLRAALQA
jgi:hypothetical protein